MDKTITLDLAYIKDLIGDANYDKVFEEFAKALDVKSNYYDDLMMLKSRYKLVVRSTNQGILSYYETTLETTKISKSLIDLLNSYSEQCDSNDTNTSVTINVDASLSTISVEGDVTDFQDEDYGIWDYEKEFTDYTAAVTESFSKITTHTNEITECISSRSAQIEKLSKDGRNVNVTVAKKITDALAEELLQYVARMEVEIEIFDDSSKKSIDAALNFLKLTYLADYDKDDLIELESAFQLSINQISDMKDGVVGTIEMFSSWPSLDRIINRATRKTISMLSDFDLKIADYIELLNDLLNNIQFSISEIKD